VRSRRARAIAVAAVMACAFFSIFAVVRFSVAIGVPPGDVKGFRVISVGTISIFLLSVVVPIAIVAVAQRVLHRGTMADLGWGRPSLRKWAIGFSIGVGVASIQRIVEAELGSDVHLRWAVPANAEIAPLVLRYALWFFALLNLNSLGEEINYRAYPIVHLVQGARHRWAILLVIALGFSAVHLFAEPSFDARAFVSRALWALLFSQLYLETRSLWLICGAHTGSNFVSLSLTGNWTSGGIFQLDVTEASDAARVVVRAIVVGLAMIVVAHWFRPRPA
jgi:hypothetical protein